MALSPVPLAIDGSKIKAKQLRLLSYKACQGNTGVTLPTDLKVISTNSTSVTITPGSASIVSTYPNAGAEAYDVDNNEATVVGVPATTTNPATRYVIIRIGDPEHGAPAPADLANGPYNFAELVSALPTNVPYIVLARINQPANTTVILQNMITDLRRVAVPQRRDETRVIYPTGTVAAGTAHAVPTGGYSSWPLRTNERPTVYVPKWATRMDVIAHYEGLHFAPSGTADTVVGIRVGWGAEGSENGIIIVDGTGDSARFGATLVGTHAVLSTQRDTDQILNLQAVRTGGAGIIRADYQSQIAIHIIFTDDPV